MTAATATAGPTGRAMSRGEPRADASAWLAVAAGSLGALMATLDVSIVNSALPTIQGEIGATGAEGTWVATAYLVAEIIVIPLSAWLERLLGLRTLLLIAATLFTAFSIVCGTATDLTSMIIGRTGQGFSGGALIPTAVSIIATRLPRPQQPIGNAIFGMTAIVGPVVGPLVGGWLTETASWHYAFFLNLPVGVMLVTLLFACMPHRPADPRELFRADWLGIAGLVLGLGCMTVVLEEGQREQWFESALIVRLTLASVVGFGLLLSGQALMARPVIKLRLLLDRQFGAVALMGLMLGMVVYGTSYVIPQFLSAIAGYDALQSGKVVMLAGIPALLMMPLVPVMIRRLDIRFAVITGLLVMAASCWLDTSLSTDSDGQSFTHSQLLRGLGTILCFLFLNQAAISSVPRSDAADAAGLFACIRNIGGSIVLAGLATFQDQRLWLHSRNLEGSLDLASGQVQEYVDTLSGALGGTEAALRSLSGTIGKEALVMTFNDAFVVLAFGILLICPLVLFLRPLPHAGEVSLH